MTVRAALRGMVDLRRHDPRDPDQRDRLVLAVRELQREELARVAELEHAQATVELLIHASLQTGVDIIEKAWKRAYEVLDRRRRLGMPWLKTIASPAEDRSLQDGLREMWIREFGDPSDPGVAAGISATARALLAQCATPGQGVSSTG